jgi:alkanesulfonate monooxygenase SsuD/methylene tetrahydromethanopterin reductase-like flavin-dependent oxidoreductase (luciferase family)
MPGGSFRGIRRTAAFQPAGQSPANRRAPRNDRRPVFVGGWWHDADMRYLVEVPNFGDFAAPEVLAEVARRAEEAGWDALLVWDHVVGEKGLRWEIADPWILLTAAALATARIRLGTAITPVARRRPSKLAREVATLDRLTGGRMVLGAGLGAPVADEYGSFGDTTDARVLAERLDEGLHALDLLWSGEPVTYRGNHVTIDDVVFRPTPVQRPRVPVWIGGIWPNKAPMRRAARWDGAIPAMADFATGRPPDVSEVRDMVAFLRACRAEDGRADQPFDIVIGGTSPAGPAGSDLAGPLAAVGATGWVERMPWGDDLGRAGPVVRRIEQGPPRI